MTVNPVADTPSVSGAATAEDTQTSSGLVISRNAADGAEVTHFKITGISNGMLYQNDGTTVVADNSFITFAEGNAGLKFTPAANFSGSGGFTVQASTSAGRRRPRRLHGERHRHRRARSTIHRRSSASRAIARRTSPGRGAVVVEQGGDVTVADIDSADFATGTLSVSFASGGVPAQDVLGIRNQGSGAGQIGSSGSNVTYGGTMIGTFTGGAGSDLVVTLNGNASSRGDRGTGPERHLHQHERRSDSHEPDDSIRPLGRRR